MLPRIEAAAVIVFVLSTVVTSVVVHGLLPKPRQTTHEPRRLDWEEHTADINNRRGLFRRMYRMDEYTFKNLAEMLRLILEQNEYYANEKRERDRESRSNGEFRVCFLWYSSTTSVAFSVVQQYNLNAMKRNIAFPVVYSSVCTTGCTQCFVVLLSYTNYYYYSLVLDCVVLYSDKLCTIFYLITYYFVHCFCMVLAVVCMATHIVRVWVNRVRLTILHVVS